MEWNVIVNPAAGRRAPTVDDLEAAARARGLSVSIDVTSTVDEMRDVVDRKIHAGSRAFVAVGGDGSTHHLLNAVMARRGRIAERFTIGIVATGSGSDFVRTFGHRPGLEAGLDRLVDPDRYNVDVGSIHGSFGTRYFLNAANTGVAAAAASRAASLPRSLGARRYTAAFWLALGGFPARDVTVTCGRHEFTGKAISVVIANGQFFGGGLNIAPRATLVDGVFDVQVFRGPKRNAFTVMPRIVHGSHLTHTAVRRYVGAEVQITGTEAWPVEADGEVLGSGPVTVTVVPGAIDVVA